MHNHLIGVDMTKPYTYSHKITTVIFFLIYCIPAHAAVRLAKVATPAEWPIVLAIGLGGYTILFLVLVYGMPWALMWRGYTDDARRWQCVAVDASLFGSTISITRTTMEIPIEPFELRMGLSALLTIAVFLGLLWLRKRRFAEICHCPT
jgi:hypothetical protein